MFKTATIALLAGNLAMTGLVGYMLLRGKTHMEQQLEQYKNKANHALRMFKQGLEDMEL